MANLRDSSKRILAFADEMTNRDASIMEEARELSLLLMSGQMSDDLVLQASIFLKTPVEDMWRLRALLNALDDDLLANERG